MNVSFGSMNSGVSPYNRNNNGMNHRENDNPYYNTGNQSSNFLRLKNQTQRSGGGGVNGGGYKEEEDENDDSRYNRSGFDSNTSGSGFGMNMVNGNGNRSMNKSGMMDISMMSGWGGRGGSASAWSETDLSRDGGSGFGTIEKKKYNATVSVVMMHVLQQIAYISKCLCYKHYAIILYSIHIIRESIFN